MSSIMSSSRLYSREELLSLYCQTLENEKDEVIRAIRPAPFTSFIIRGVMSSKQETDWSSMSRHDSRRALIDFVLEENTLERYIKFSQCVHYINSAKAEQIFEFIPNLIHVGLHDSIRMKGELSSMLF